MTSLKVQLILGKRWLSATTSPKQPFDGTPRESSSGNGPVTDAHRVELMLLTHQRNPINGEAETQRADVKAQLRRTYASP